MLWSYCLGRWVRTSEAQLRWQVETVASDPAPEKPGLAPMRLPRLQRCRRGKRRCDAVTDHHGL